MKFEYDPKKSTLNKDKHGTDFDKAQELWDDPDGIGSSAKSDDEDRYALLAMRGGTLWVAFYTHREERRRIISTRRARSSERKLYES